MSEKKTVSISKNYLYNSLYQALALGIPLITTPYASRMFGPEGIGVQSYVNSVASFFSLFAALGVASYGQREIARHRDSQEKIKKLFWEIELLCLMTTTICLVVWFFVAYFERDYTEYFLATSFTVLAVAFDITWFFAGLEEFRFIVLRNSIVKVIGVILLFVAVQEANDLLLYMGLFSAIGLVGNISMWTYLPKVLGKSKCGKLKPFRHLRETLVYFVPTIASSMYTVLDKTMLRILTGGTLENGFYEETTKIIRMVQVLLLSINTVMSSRMSYLFAQEKYEEIKQRLEQSISFILLLGVPFTMGIMGIAKNFVPWFFGAGFDAVIPLLWIYSPLLIVVGISNCLGTQYLTPSGQRGRSSKGIIAGAVVNFCLNLMMIPMAGALGATVASVLAEVLIAAVYIYMSKEYVSIRILWKHLYKRVFAGMIMLGSVLLLQLLPIRGVALTILQIFLGAIIYFILLIALKDDMILEGIEKVASKLEGR